MIRHFLGIANFWSMTIGSINLHIWQYVAFHALHVRVPSFLFVHFIASSSLPFDDVNWPEFAVVSMKKGLDNLSTFLLFLSLKRWFQFNSRILRILRLVKWEVISETRGDIFSWRSRFVDFVFAYIKLSKIYFGADRVRWRVKWFGKKREYSSQSMRTIFSFPYSL